MSLIINGRFLLARQTGVQRFARMITEQIIDKYPDSLIVTPQNNLDLSLPTVPTGNLQGYAWEQIDLPRFLKSQGSPLLLNLASTAPVNYKNQISTIHDITYIRFPESFSKKFRITYQILVPKIIENSRHILTVSDFSKEEISSYFNIDKNRISVVYNSASSIFSPSGAKYNPGFEYFLTVSSPNKHKNVERLYEAFCRAQTDKKLLVVGKQESKVFNSTAGNFSGKIMFTGAVDDKHLAELYRGSAAFLFPSLYEGFGIPPLEAQKSGVPVLASYAASLPEVLGDSVRYVNPYSIDSIKNGIEGMESADANVDLIQKGFINVNQYSWKKSADLVMNLIDNH